MAVLKINHWVDATPQEVWDAYTTPEKFCLFFSPEGLSIPLESVVLEIRVGGRFECDMVFDDTGIVNSNQGILVEFEEPHLLVGAEPSIGFRSTQRFLDEAGGTLISIEQEGLPDELVGNPEVHEAFRSSYRKLGRLLGKATENRPCE